MRNIPIALLLIITIACNSNTSSQPAIQTDTVVENTWYKKIKEIPLPDGYTRIKFTDNSFAAYLQNINLKKDKTVYTYDGKIKPNQTAQFAVLDISVGNKDLQQCADAVMRLRAEYLYAHQRMNEIIFIDNEGGKYLFTQPFTRPRFDAYLQKVFGMCGTASLSKQLKPINNINKIAAGDVIIRGGFPGHAVIVMDVAQNKAGDKIYLLAQSYMPAQSIHVLNNPMDEKLSPWYQANDDNIIHTPEYTFYKKELMTW